MLFDDFAQNSSAKVLWAIRMIMLSLLFGLWSYNGFGQECLVLLLFSALIYSVSASLGAQAATTRLKAGQVRTYKLCFYLANVSLINWALAIPYSLGKSRYIERGVWLVVNLIVFAILAGVYFTDGPMRSAWGCYPPSVSWNEIGSAGICPQSSKGTYLTCNTPPVKTSAYLACQSFGWVESLGSDGIRVAILLAAVSAGVYVASIPRNFRSISD